MICRVVHEDEETHIVDVLELEHGVNQVKYPNINRIKILDELPHHNRDCYWCWCLRHNTKMNNGIDDGEYLYTGNKKTEKMFTENPLVLDLE